MNERGSQRLAFDLPLGQLPDLGLQRAGLGPDLGVDGDRLAQLVEGSLDVPARVEQIGEVIVKRRLAVTVALGLTEGERRFGVLDGLHVITASCANQRQVVEPGGAGRGIARPIRDRQALLEVPPRADQVPGAGREDAEEVVGVGQGAIIRKSRPPVGSGQAASGAPWSGCAAR